MTRYPLYRRLGVPQGRSGRAEKSRPPTGIRSPAVQPVVSHYTVWATRPLNPVFFYLSLFNSVAKSILNFKNIWGHFPPLNPQFTSTYTAAAQYSIWIANVWLHYVPRNWKYLWIFCGLSNDAVEVMRKGMPVGPVAQNRMQHLLNTKCHLYSELTCWNLFMKMNKCFTPLKTLC